MSNYTDQISVKINSIHCKPIKLHESQIQVNLVQWDPNYRTTHLKSVGSKKTQPNASSCLQTVSHLKQQRKETTVFEQKADASSGWAAICFYHFCRAFTWLVIHKLFWNNSCFQLSFIFYYSLLLCILQMLNFLLQNLHTHVLIAHIFVLMPWAKEDRKHRL